MEGERGGGRGALENIPRHNDSPVLEAVSGLELSPHLEVDPSSVRGCLTHIALIDGSLL